MGHNYIGHNYIVGSDTRTWRYMALEAERFERFAPAVISVAHRDISSADEQRQLKSLTALEFGGAELEMVNWWSSFESWIAFVSDHEPVYAANGDLVPPSRFYDWYEGHN